jgi:hypothetical protein
MLSVIMLSVILLSVTMLSVILLSAVAPNNVLHSSSDFKYWTRVELTDS